MQAEPDPPQTVVEMPAGGIQELPLTQPVQQLPLRHVPPVHGPPVVGEVVHEPFEHAGAWHWPAGQAEHLVPIPHCETLWLPTPMQVLPPPRQPLEQQVPPVSQNPLPSWHWLPGSILHWVVPGPIQV